MSRAVLRTGATIRYHAQPEIPVQTVAEHAWGVAALLVRWFKEDLTVNMLAAAIVHDSGECDVGDIPSPTKKKFPELRKELAKLEHAKMAKLGLADYEGQLSHHEYALLKLCDMLEGYFYTGKAVLRYNEGMTTLLCWHEMIKDHIEANLIAIPVGLREEIGAVLRLAKHQGN